MKKSILNGLFRLSFPQHSTLLNSHSNKRSFIYSSLVVEDVLYWLQKMQRTYPRGPSIKDVGMFFQFLTTPSTLPAYTIRNKSRA